jgi:uncharacterized membrane protein
MNAFLTVLKKCVNGLYDILQSLSGTFALITLAVIAVVTWHAPTVGGIALSAFATVIPAILAYAENKETLQAAASQAQQAISTQTQVVVQQPPTVVINNTADPTNSDLPPNGQV